MSRMRDAPRTASNMVRGGARSWPLAGPSQLAVDEGLNIKRFDREKDTATCLYCSQREKIILKIDIVSVSVFISVYNDHIFKGISGGKIKVVSLWV